MKQLRTKPFPYYVGVFSLEELVNKETKVCVINILGSESRKVTPVSHEYSGGNIVAGVQYGRKGALETKLGEIPVFPSIREVIRANIQFDIGVIYLPPTAVSQAVAELVYFNPNLKRIVIVTEKVPARDSMYIRYICQEAGIDVIGCNCLGVANVWDKVRVGGALGGDDPETMLPGSVAIHSNSGNFTTTISEYLKTNGFGISTAVSSGKDVYIHFALPEFLFAAQNDPRTKAVALYVEPGGYYEKNALDWIEERKFGFNKPIVVCVTGRWKKELSRSCGHAGALAGAGDDAESKEKCFDDYFEVGVFDPKNPVVSKKGVRIASIQDFPKAMKAVYEKIGEQPDFAPAGDLSLKLWLSDNFMPMPKELTLPVVTALEPYDKQILQINKQIGAHLLRQNMRDKSGASRMDPQSQVTELHGKTILDLSHLSIEENLYFTLAKSMPDKNDIPTINLLLNLFLEINEDQVKMLRQAKANGCTPNSYLASQIAMIGETPLLKNTQKYTKVIIDLIRENGIDEDTKVFPEQVTDYILNNLLEKADKQENKIADALVNEFKTAKKKYEAIHLCQYIIKLAEEKQLEIRDKVPFLLAGIAVSIFWKQMLEKRISRSVAEDSIYYFYTVAQLVAFSIIDPDKNNYWKELTGHDPKNLKASFTENVFKILFNREAAGEELTELKYVIGLTLSNGPGTISAKGAKETVSARNHIPTAYVGFLVNTGLAHGGNGFEAVDFLLRTFKDTGLDNPGNPDHKINLQELAIKTARIYREYKKKEQDTGKLEYTRIPCVNHPVFKGHDVNIDPREAFVKKELDSKKIYNIFLEFYHRLVIELFNEGATKNIFCVNVDAVISVIALKLVWKDLVEGKLSQKQVQDLVFTLFLVGRAVGVSAEIADHRDRGQDMDCRTPQSQLQFVL